MRPHGESPQVLALWGLLLASGLLGAQGVDARAGESPTWTAEEAGAAGEGQTPGSTCPLGDDQAAQEERVARIIHGASSLAGLAAGGLAQVPYAGPMVVPCIQAGMVFEIGRTYGCHMDRAACFSVVAYLASEQMRSALTREILGFIPLFGNVMQGSMTFFMTEGIGFLAAKNLKCGDASGILSLFEASRSGDASEENSTSPASRQLFHFVTDLLSGLDVGLSKAQAAEAWRQLTEMFSAKAQEMLMEEVRLAGTVEELSEIMRRYPWNWELVGSVLLALEERFPRRDACAPVDFVADRFWTGRRAGPDSRTTVAPYLERCVRWSSRETWSALMKFVRVQISDAANTQYTHGASSVERDQSISLLVKLLEDWEDLVTSAAASPPLGHEPLPAPAFLLSAEEVVSVLGALVTVYTRGAPRACAALRTLLRLTGSGAPGVGHGVSSAVAGWPTVRRLQRLEARMVEPPPGAEICAPALWQDLRDLMSLPGIPTDSEVAQRTTGKVSEPATSRTLEGRLAKVMVGQKCGLSRLLDRPGHLKSKIRGLWPVDLPLVLLLTGPSGTGKTHLAMSIAEVLHGRPASELQSAGKLRLFQMNQFSVEADTKTFFGPPAGTHGGGRGALPELLKEWPDAFIILDEVEKAHHTFAQGLLKVFGEQGSTYDVSTNKDVPTTRATFVLTSNFAKDVIAGNASEVRAAAAAAAEVAAGGGFEEDADVCSSYERLRAGVVDALAAPTAHGRINFFRESEVRGRLTDVIPFMPFTEGEVRTAVRRFLEEEARALSEDSRFQLATLAWEPAVVPAMAMLYEQRMEEGLRPLRKHLIAEVKQAVGSALELGLIHPAGGALLRLEASSGGMPRLDLRAIPPAAPAAPAAATEEAAGVAGAAESTAFAWLRSVGGAMWAGGNAASTPGASDGGAHWSGIVAAPLATFAGVAQRWAGVGGSAAAAPEDDSGFSFEYEPAWGWSLQWKEVWLFMWTWRYEFLLMSLLLLASFVFIPPVVSVSAASSGFAASAIYSGGAAPAAAAAGAASASLGAATHAASLFHLAATVGTAAVPMLISVYSWQNRHYIAAAVWATMTVMALPAVVRLTRRVDELADARCRMAPDRRRPLRRSAKTDVFRRQSALAAAAGADAPRQKRVRSDTAPEWLRETPPPAPQAGAAVQIQAEATKLAVEADAPAPAA